MQPKIRDAWTINSIEMQHEPPVDGRFDETTSFRSRARRRIDDALDWLDRYWDDPERRSGFWRSGW